MHSLYRPCWRFGNVQCQALPCCYPEHQAPKRHDNCNHVQSILRHLQNWVQSEYTSVNSSDVTPPSQEIAGHLLMFNPGDGVFAIFILARGSAFAYPQDSPGALDTFTVLVYHVVKNVVYEVKQTFEVESQNQQGMQKLIEIFKEICSYFFIQCFFMVQVVCSNIFLLIYVENYANWLLRSINGANIKCSLYWTQCI